jgi:hypothetical protein
MAPFFKRADGLSNQIPSEVKEILSKHSEIKWDKIASKSKLIHHNVNKLDKAVKSTL